MAQCSEVYRYPLSGDTDEDHNGGEGGEGKLWYFGCGGPTFRVGIKTKLLPCSLVLVHQSLGEKKPEKK